MVMTTEAVRVIETAEAFLSAVSGYDPAGATAGDCVAIAEVTARVEKGASGLRVLAAVRAVDAGAHKEAGVADPVAWVARQGGTTGSEARGALEFARSLDAHPATKEALLSGDVSFAQAREIAKFEDEAPGHEQELLEVAKAGDLTKLRDDTRERRLSRTRPEDLHERQMAARRFRHWKDGLGMVCFEGALPPETGLPFVQRIEREAARRKTDAKRDGTAERFEVHSADALVALTAGGGAGAKGRTDLVVVCDLYAWRRGYARTGETCHLIGGGPIPVDLAKELSEDAFIKVVLHDGVEIQKVHHVGRKYTAELRTALDLGPVPAFTGRVCIDCGRTWGLQNDHDDPVAHTGLTSYDNIRARCYRCHQEKTERDRKAGLLRGTAKAGGRPSKRVGTRPRATAPATARTQKRLGLPGRDPP